MDYQLPKGTHDIIGAEARLYEEVIALMKQVAGIYGYQPIATPIFEHTELFTRSVGEGSDIVRKEMYTFLDKGDRSLTLRPELTAGAMRAIVNQKLDKTSNLPIKLYYEGPAFRYERPQLGRFRQFHQFGIEAVGISTPLNDVEAIMMGTYILQTLGFKSLQVKINSLGDKMSRDGYREALKGYFTPHIDKMCPDCKNRLEINPLRILDCKVPADQTLAKKAPKISDYLSEEAKNYFNNVLKYLDQYEIPYVIDNQLVRGLDYYSHVVYEYHLTDEVGRNYGAIGAGGHYDNLLAELGGKDLPGVGFGLGLERIIALINELKIAPDLSHTIECFVMPLAAEQVPYAYAIAMLLRSSGLACDMAYEPKNIKAQIKAAVAMGAQFGLIVGEEELKQESITIKNLETQTQEAVPLKELLAYLRKAYGHNHDCHCREDEECQCQEGEKCDCDCEEHECYCQEGEGCDCDCEEHECHCHDEDEPGKKEHE
jgi:histidyl-tRNA synthetase